MKKTKLLVLLVAVVMALSVFALVACETEKTGTAYGLVHGQGYVGKATVTHKGETISAATLDEACFPTQKKLTADEKAALGADDVAGDYYKTVKIGGIEMVYDSEAKLYKVGTKTTKEYFTSATECEKYYKGVEANDIKVKIGTTYTDGKITKNDLLKSLNGYWGTPAAAALGWTANRDATCAYVVANGFGGANAKTDFVVTNNSATNAKLDNEMVDKNGVKTGATWTDMWDYFTILKSAYEAK